MLRHSFASLRRRSRYIEPTIASLLGHKTHSITSRDMHSADAVLLAAADAVANDTMKLMARYQPQPQLRNQQRDGSVVREGFQQVSDICDRICRQPIGTIHLFADGIV